MTDIRSIVRDANPKPLAHANPDPDVVAQILESVRTTTRGSSVRPEHRPRGSRWLIAVAAGVTALALVGVGFLMSGAGGDVTAPSNASVAEAYLLARNAYDAEAAAAVVADAADLRDLPAMFARSELPLAFRYLEMIEERYIAFTCVPTGPAEVVCDFVLDSALRSKSSLPPIPGQTTFAIESGRITEIRAAIETEPYDMLAREWADFLGADQTGYYRFVVDRDGRPQLSARLDSDLLDELELRVDAYLEGG